MAYTPIHPACEEWTRAYIAAFAARIAARPLTDPESAAAAAARYADAAFEYLARSPYRED